MSDHDLLPAEPSAPPVLAVDVGGSHVKMLLNGGQERRRFASGKRLTPEAMVTGVLELAEGWDYPGSVWACRPWCAQGASSTSPPISDAAGSASTSNRRSGSRRRS